LTVPFDVEGRGLVAPLDHVEVKQRCELPLTVMSESHLLVGQE
jgi:hypothetical protein